MIRVVSAKRLRQLEQRINELEKKKFKATVTTLPRTLSIADAAAASGMTVKSLRGRCDRGSLRYVIRDGKRMIPTRDLIAAGLIDPRIYKENTQ